MIPPVLVLVLVDLKRGSIMRKLQFKLFESKSSKYQPSTEPLSNQVFVAPYGDDPIELKQFFNGSLDDKILLMLEKEQIFIKSAGGRDREDRTPIFNTEMQAIEYLRNRMTPENLHILQIDASREKLLGCLKIGKGFGKLIIQATDYASILENWNNESHPTVRVTKNPYFVKVSEKSEPRISVSQILIT